MAVKVEGGVPGGQAWIKGTTSSGPQAAYYCFNNSTQELSVVAAGAKNRLDSPIAQVQDAQYAGAENTFTLSVVKGSEVSEVEPSLPASSMQLASVKVNAGATKIENANITDKRVVLFLSTTISQEPGTKQGVVSWAKCTEGSITLQSGDFTSIEKTAVGEYRLKFAKKSTENILILVSGDSLAETVGRGFVSLIEEGKAAAVTIVMETLAKVKVDCKFNVVIIALS
jgi:hypothetical protein